MKRIAIIGALVLSACATVPDPLIGQPIQAAFVQFGPPTASFSMPDGSRAFQWSKDVTVTTPGEATVTENGPVNRFDPTPYSVSVEREPSVTQRHRCLMTIIANSNADGQFLIARREATPCPT